MADGCGGAWELPVGGYGLVKEDADARCRMQDARGAAFSGAPILAGILAGKGGRDARPIGAPIAHNTITTMDATTLYRHYEEYHRKKWFPELYPDPLGPFADAITEDTLRELETALKARPSDVHTAALIRVLLGMLPVKHHSDLFTIANRFLNVPISGAPARFLLYYLRRVPLEQQQQLREEIVRWARESRTPLTEWLQARTTIERQHGALAQSALTAWGVDFQTTLISIENSLRLTRDLLDWEVRSFGSNRTFEDYLAHLRLLNAESMADWDDFPALAQTWAEAMHIPNLPRLQPSTEDPAVQFTFAIAPPARVRVHYGKAAGPVDTYRFLRELGRSLFYVDMAPELQPEQKLLGDPALPEFWAELYGLVFLRPAGISRLIRAGTEDLAEQLRPAIRLRIRHESVLALYSARVDSSLKDAQDLYVSLWETAFTFPASHHLYLFDLERAETSLFTVHAFRAALGVEEHLRSLYGNQWFALERCASRLRDYRRSGFALRLADIVSDLGASPTDHLL